MRALVALLGAVALSGCASASMQASPETARIWVTSGDRSALLAEQTPLTFKAASGDDAALITVDASARHQSIVGFGAAVTDASAFLIQTKLTELQRDALLRELFGRGDGGLGFSFTRLTIGASDFSRSHYSLDDVPPGGSDPELARFSAAPMAEHVFPTVRAALAINPDLKVMASPWSAPAWMKTTDSLITGQLKRDAYPVYARYFQRYVEAAAAEGVPTHYLSIQNEPDFEPDSYPGMRWSAADRADFVGDHLGPLFERAGIETDILDWDHNWDQPQQALTTFADPEASRYLTGVAWHCYNGEVSAQDQVHRAYPDKETFFTECSGGNWSPDFAESFVWQMKNLIIGSTVGWSRGVLMWNLALDENHGPHAGGCGDCRGVVTIDSRSGEITRNQEYYAFGHASRFVRPGAVRIGADGPADLPAVAFVNPDGGRVLIVLNDQATPRALAAAEGGEVVRATLPPMSAATLTWD